MRMMRRRSQSIEGSIHDHGGDHDDVGDDGDDDVSASSDSKLDECKCYLLIDNFIYFYTFNHIYIFSQILR